jgi:hypothetical protein
VIQVEESILVSLPRKRVFLFAAKPQNMPLWNPVIRESRPQGALKPGATVVQLVELLDRQFETLYQVTAYEPYRKVAYTTSTGPVEIEGTMDFETEPGGTRVTWTVTGGCRGLLRVAEGVLSSLGRPEMRTCLENLKRVVEAREHGDEVPALQPFGSIGTAAPSLLSRSRRLVALAATLVPQRV